MRATFTRRTALGRLIGLGFAAALMAAFASAPAAAGDYPKRPIRLLVGYSAGGGADAVARILATHLAEVLGQPVIVDNRAGAAGALAADQIARAEPDGYTIYFADTGILVGPVLSKVAYDPVKSFTPIGRVGLAYIVLAADPALPANGVEDLIKLAKDKPGKLAYGTPGTGTIQNLAGEMLKMQTGVDILHVPYKGASAALTDVMAGTIPLAMVSAPPALAQAKAGKLKILAVTSLDPIPTAPEIPTVSKVLPGFDATTKLFVVAPAGTPPAVVDTLSTAIGKVLSEPSVKEALIAQGALAAPSSPAELAAELASDTVKWTDVARRAGVQQ